MTEKNIITILGSGTSTGIPIVGCTCDVCLSTSPKNKRFRSSILISTRNGKNILVDTTPDLRSQALAQKIINIDSCIITHTHADHCHGIDDLRSFTFFKNKSISVYGSKETYDILKIKFDYIFDKTLKISGPIPLLDFKEVKNMEYTKIDEDEFYFFNLPHGRTKSTCFYTDGLAYLIDCASIPDKVIDFLANKKLNLLILDCNSKLKPHKTHLYLPQSLEYAKRINAKQTGLIHMTHDFDHESFEEELKIQGLSSIFPVYDGQKLKY